MSIQLRELASASKGGPPSQACLGCCCATVNASCSTMQERSSNMRGEIRMPCTPGTGAHHFSIRDADTAKAARGVQWTTAFLAMGASPHEVAMHGPLQHLSLRTLHDVWSLCAAQN